MKSELCSDHSKIENNLESINNKIDFLQDKIDGIQSSIFEIRIEMARRNAYLSGIKTAVRILIVITSSIIGLLGYKELGSQLGNLFK